MAGMNSELEKSIEETRVLMTKFFDEGNVQGYQKASETYLALCKQRLEEQLAANEIADKQLTTSLKAAEMKQDGKHKTIDHVLNGLKIGGGLLLGMFTFCAGMKFEETGSFSSKTFMSWLPWYRPKN